MVNLASVAHPCWGEVPIRIKDYPRRLPGITFWLVRLGTPHHQRTHSVKARRSWPLSSPGLVVLSRARALSVTLSPPSNKKTHYTHPPQAHISLAVGVSFSLSPHTGTWHCTWYYQGGTNYSFPRLASFYQGCVCGLLSLPSRTHTLPCPIFSARTPSLFFIPHSAHTPEVPRPRLLQVRTCSFLAW